MITFRDRLKKARKSTHSRLRVDLEKLRDPHVACNFQATIGGKFAPLTGLMDDDIDINTTNKALTNAASELQNYPGQV